MSTKGAIGFFIDGTLKLTHVLHSGSVFDMGLQATKFVRKHPDAKIAEIARAITFVDEATPVPEDLRESLAAKAYELRIARGKDRILVRRKELSDSALQILEMSADVCHKEVLLLPDLSWGRLFEIMSYDFGVYDGNIAVMSDAADYPNSEWCEIVVLVDVDAGTIEAYTSADADTSLVPGQERWVGKQRLVCSTSFENARSINDPAEWWATIEKTLAEEADK